MRNFSRVDHVCPSEMTGGAFLCHSAFGSKVLECPDLDLGEEFCKTRMFLDVHGNLRQQGYTSLFTCLRADFAHLDASSGLAAGSSSRPRILQTAIGTAS